MGADNVPSSDHITEGGMRNHRERSTRLRAGGDWHAFSPIGRGDGNVPRRGTGLHDHADRQMVERRLLAVHSAAGRTILERRGT